MEAPELIAALVALEGVTGDTGQLEMRAFVIEAQDCILRMQEEILELRREYLRYRGESSRSRILSAFAPDSTNLSNGEFAA